MICNMDELLCTMATTPDFEAFPSKRQIVCLFVCSFFGFLFVCLFVCFFNIFVLQDASGYEILVLHVPHVHHN